MKRAESLVEIYQNFTPNLALTLEEKEQYIDVYKSQLKELTYDIVNNKNSSQTIYVSGHSGSGKTTALNFIKLQNKKIESEYEILYLNGNNLFNLDDIDIIDVLLMVAKELTVDREDLLLTFGKDLIKIVDNIRKRFTETIEEEKNSNISANVKGALGLGLADVLKWTSGYKAESEFWVSYRTNFEKRILTRKVFEANIEDLLKLVNKIIAKRNSDKKLMLIFQEFNHMKDIEVIKNLFIKNRYYLESISAKKIFTVPIILGQEQLPSRVIHFNIKVYSNPNNPNNELELCKEGIQTLKEIVYSRISKNKKTLLHEDSLEKAIELSGGNLRQLISIIHYSARNADIAESDHISNLDIEEGANDFRDTLTGLFLSPTKIKMMYEVMKTNIAQGDDELFSECLLRNQILKNENGEDWFKVNPLLTDTVETYYKKLTKNEE